MTSDAKTLFNPNTTAVVFDRDGRIVGGGERVQVDKVDKVAQEAVEHGLLVLEEPERADEEAGSADKSEEAPAKKASGASPARKAT
jgi:hypothetical protein